MDREALDDFFVRAGEAFWTGDMGIFAPFLRLPLAVYTPLGLTLIKDRSALDQMFTLYKGVLDTYRIVIGVPTVIEFAPYGEHRIKAVVQFDDYDAEGRRVTGSLCRYFLDRAKDDCVIEMVEFLYLAVTDDEAKRILH